MKIAAIAGLLTLTSFQLLYGQNADTVRPLFDSNVWLLSGKVLSKEVKNRSILSPRAFQKFAKNYFSYAITGSNTPVSGLKVSTVNPSVSISGNLYVNKSKSFILNSQLTGGADNNISQIFAGNKLNGYFKGSLGAYFFLNTRLLTGGVYTADDYQINYRRSKYRAKVSAVIDKQIDSAVIIDQLQQAVYTAIKANSRGLPSLDRFDSTCADTINALYRNEQASPSSRFSTIRTRFQPHGITIAAVREIVIAMVRGYLKDNATPEDKLLDKFLETYLADDIGQFDEDYNRKGFLGHVPTMENYVDTTAISILGPLFENVRTSWINVSPSINNNAYTFYDTINKKFADTTSLLYGITVSLNILKKSVGSYRFFYEQIGITYQRTNNVTDLSKINYQTLNTLTSTGTSVSQKSKSGTAYSGALANGWGWNQFYEMDWLFTKSQYFPGLYLRYDWSYQSTALNKNKFSPTLGMIWNFSSGDNSSTAGAKNVVSLVPFVNYSNLAHNTDPNGQATKSSARWSVGVNLSLPININNN